MRQNGYTSAGDFGVSTPTIEDVRAEVREMGWETDEEFEQDTAVGVGELVGMVWLLMGDGEGNRIFIHGRCGEVQLKEDV
jgi:hypothetical protein